MKVLYVTNLPAPYKIEYFTRLSDNVELTVAYERKTAKDRNKAWKIEMYPQNFEEIWLDGKEISTESSFSLDIIKLLRMRQFDTVIMNGFSSPTAMITIFYMILHNINYAIMCDGMLPRECGKIKRIIKKFLISNASYYLSSNDITSNVLESFGADRKRIFLYPFSSVTKKEIVTNSYDKDIYKKKIGFNNDIIILFVGQFIPRKGIDILIKAFEKTVLNAYKDLKLLFIGGNKIEEKIDLRIQEKIEIIGFKRKDELRDYYLAADLLVLPTREDIWGLVVNEALACGTPVITTDRCGAGIALIKNGENGFVVPVEDYNALSDAIEKTIKKKPLQENILSSVKLYTIEEMAARTLEVLDKCVTL